MAEREQLDDRALVSRVLEGDRDRFTELVKRYEKRVVNYVYRITHRLDEKAGARHGQEQALPGEEHAQGYAGRVRGAPMKDHCQRYLEDPEANPGNLAECEQCRALFDTLGLSAETRPVSVGALPLAS